MDRLEPIRRLLDRSADRDNPSAERLRDLFAEIEHIAVVGLSRDPLKAARRVPSYLAAKGYEIYPVNPNADRILGRLAVPRLDALSDPMDMVLVFRPSGEAGAVVADAAARPERPAIWLQEGIRANADAAEARKSGSVVIQDLCAYRVHRDLFE